MRYEKREHMLVKPVLRLKCGTRREKTTQKRRTIDVAAGAHTDDIAETIDAKVGAVAVAGVVDYAEEFAIVETGDRLVARFAGELRGLVETLQNLSSLS